MVIAAFPDWSRYAVPGGNFVVQQTFPAGTPQVGSITDVSQWTNVVIIVGNNDLVSYIQIDVQWLSADGGLSGDNGTSFVVGPSQGAVMVLSVRDRQIAISMSNVSAPQTAGFIYTVYGLNHVASRYDMWHFYGAILEDVTAYGAGGVKSINFGDWYEGPVSVTVFSSNNTAAYVEFQYFSLVDDNWHDFAATGITAAAQTVSRVIFCPRAPCRARITNSGAAQTIAITVVPVSQQ